jgi:hypothetical protein
MQSDFYKAGYDDALEKMAFWGNIAKGIGTGIATAGKWLKGLGTKAPAAPAQLSLPGMAPAATKPGWLASKAQGAAQGLGQSFENLAAAPGQTLWQGAGNFGKNMLGMGQANTTSGVLGRGAMGYGLLRGATGGFGNGSQPSPGQLPGPGQIQ